MALGSSRQNVVLSEDTATDMTQPLSTSTTCTKPWHITFRKTTVSRGHSTQTRLFLHKREGEGGWMCFQTIGAVPCMAWTGVHERQCRGPESMQHPAVNTSLLHRFSCALPTPMSVAPVGLKAAGGGGTLQAKGNLVQTSSTTRSLDLVGCTSMTSMTSAHMSVQNVEHCCCFDGILRCFVQCCISLCCNGRMF